MLRFFSSLGNHYLLLFLRSLIFSFCGTSIIYPIYEAFILIKYEKVVIFKISMIIILQGSLQKTFFLYR